MTAHTLLYCRQPIALVNGPQTHWHSAQRLATATGGGNGDTVLPYLQSVCANINARRLSPCDMAVL
jgi:hypothetical protein